MKAVSCSLNKVSTPKMQYNYFEHAEGTLLGFFLISPGLRWCFVYLLCFLPFLSLLGQYAKCLAQSLKTQESTILLEPCFMDHSFHKDAGAEWCSKYCLCFHIYLIPRDVQVKYIMKLPFVSNLSVEKRHKKIIAYLCQIKMVGNKRITVTHAQVPLKWWFNKYSISIRFCLIRVHTFPTSQDSAWIICNNPSYHSCFNNRNSADFKPSAEMPVLTYLLMEITFRKSPLFGSTGVDFIYMSILFSRNVPPGDNYLHMF